MIGVSNGLRDIWVAGLAFILLWYWVDNDWILAIGVLYVLACAIFPKLKIQNQLFWKKLNHVLQLIFQPLLFGVIYICFVIPLGLLFQLFRRKSNFQSTSFRDVDRPIDDVFFKVPW